MKRYNILNNSLGWLCFVIAAVTYLLTLEPTASFWDCPEFITQAFKLEVGHPPGNPIFMLTARFFVNFAGGDVTKVAWMVNCMSGLLSAATILLLFWTVTHLVKRLIVRDDANDVSVGKMIVIFGSGLCGALAYTWSDTFWFSAVEGEVYAFSSFCTALVFWLALKWENRADRPHSDKYLILIAYVIGISIAVHLLNLLCIPAIVLVIYYRKWKDTSATGSFIALGVSAVIVGLILYGLVPGFIEISQYFELFFVNVCGLSYNMGVVIYAAILVAAFAWAMYELARHTSVNRIRLSVLLSVFLSGIFFIGSSWIVPVVLTGGAIAYLWGARALNVRILNIVVISIFVIFVGYSSYALLLIRSTANPPMNQNAPDNVFDLASYLNREQYGDRPLFYGQTFGSYPLYQADNSMTGYHVVSDQGDALYSKTVKESPDQPDSYTQTGNKTDYVYTPELNMLFPRMYSGAHRDSYVDWTGMTGKTVDATIIIDENGEPLRKMPLVKPTMGENLQFFLVYQLNHMYWRYFMWNFAGRQNDIQGNGEVNHGNWISGIPFIDNPRLGDQSLLPYEEGEGNKGHNVFYMLPLLMGIIGLCWQAFHSKRGIEQFWVVFFMFFMTGIAIVLYLNQTPTQPRERDYAFAGSFYAFAIWIGMGVAGLWALMRTYIFDKKSAAKGPKPAAEAAEEKPMTKGALIAAVIAAAVGIAVPLQMVSQTWDDHDRSGRYMARDTGFNYLNSLKPDAVIFTNGDNDTFPLWYAQEVEGVRTDVKVVNQSYLTTSWYANMLREPSYEARPVDMIARPADYAYDRLQYIHLAEDVDSTLTDVNVMLRTLYDRKSEIRTPYIYIPVDSAAIVKSHRLSPADAMRLAPAMFTNLEPFGGMSLGNTLTLDMLATSMKNGWNRPIYFAMTVPNEFYLGLEPYMRLTGMAYEVTPMQNAEGTEIDKSGISVDTDYAYDVIVNKYRWGGLDVAEPGSLYLDETVRRMVTSTRLSISSVAQALVTEALMMENPATNPAAQEKFKKARTLLQLSEKKLPGKASPYSLDDVYQMAILYYEIGENTGSKADKAHALELLHSDLMRYGRAVAYFQSLTPSQYQTLQRADKYIHVVYMPQLMSAYHQYGGDLDKLCTELEAIGVDINRLLQDANAYAD